VDRRHALLEHLQHREIGAGIHYPVPIHRLALYRDLARGPDDLPVTSAAGRILSLPMYPELGEAGVREVVGAVSDYYRSS
jgi:dTDP-4-amino-4,6-dideoxygalactose transaminase